MGTMVEQETEQTREEEEVNRLTDMVVTDVDLVDRAANGRRFILFKREAGMPDENSVEVVQSPDGSVVDVQVSETDADVESGNEPGTGDGGTATPDTDAAAATGEKKPVKKAGENGKEEEEEEEEQKKGEGEEEDKDKNKKKDKEVVKSTISKPVQEAVTGFLREASERLMSVVTVLRSATATEDETQTPLPNQVHGEIAKIRTLLSSVTEKYPAPVATTKVEGEEGGEQEVAKQGAHQTLLNEKVGTIQKLATDIASGTMEPADLKAAMGQMRDIMWAMDGDLAVTSVAKNEKGDKGPSVAETTKELLKQTFSLPGAVRDVVVEKLNTGIETLLTVIKQVRDMETTDEESQTPMPSELASAIQAIASELGSLVEQYPSPASKSDMVMSRLQGHFDHIEANFQGLKETLKEILVSDTSETQKEFPEEEEEEEDEDKKKEGEPMTKAESDRLEKLEKNLDKLVESLKPGDKKPVVPASNAADTDGDGEQAGVEKKEKSHAWPQDLAEDIKKRAKEDGK